MGEIQVTPAHLLDSGRNLRGIAEELRHLQRLIEELRTMPLGSAVMQTAVDAYTREWRYGMTRLADRAAMTGEALLSAGRAYEQVDAEVAGSASPP